MKRYIKASVLPLADMDTEDLVEIANDPETSYKDLKEITENAMEFYILRAILQNPNVTPELIDIMVNRDFKDLSIYETIVFLNQPYTDKVSTENLTTIANRIIDRSISHSSRSLTYEAEWLLFDIAKHPNTSKATLKKLITLADSIYDNVDLIANISHSPRISKDLLLYMISLDDWNTEWAIQNPNVDLDFIIELSKKLQDGKPVGIAVALAGDKRTPPEILSELAKSDNYSVLSAVVTNKNTPVETLKELVNNEEPGIRSHAKMALKNLGVNI